MTIPGIGRRLFTALAADPRAVHTSAAANECRATGDDVIAQRAREQVELRVALERTLRGVAAVTTSELVDLMGTRPWRGAYLCSAGCKQHLHDEVSWLPYRRTAVQQELLRLEHRGLVSRAILPGGHAHLWWWLG